MRRLLAACGAASLLFWLAPPAAAYWLYGQRWASGSNIVMNLQLGSIAGGGTLIDGSSDWNTPAEHALAIWNEYLNGVSFRLTRDSARTGLPNGINNVFWDDDVYGDSFGDAVAYSRWTYNTSNNTLTEADVVFNNTKSWNSFRGNLRRGQSGTVYDVRRVALHEFGHVLGLGHPDEHGQSVSAIMNSRVSDIDGLQSDDINGARGIYGAATPANRSPTVTATCSPCTVDTTRTTDLRASASDPDGDALTYQWSASLGTFSSATAANTTWTAPGQPGNVTVTVRVQDSRGASATATVTIQVIPRDRLDSGSALLPGHTLVSRNGRYRLAYQSDGNLVLYDDTNQSAPWATNTGGTSAGQAALQRDGNFVVYDAQGSARFATGTSGNANYLLVQNDGNVVVYRSDGQPVWDRNR